MEIIYTSRIRTVPAMQRASVCTTDSNFCRRTGRVQRCADFFDLQGRVEHKDENQDNATLLADDLPGQLLRCQACRSLMDCTPAGPQGGADYHFAPSMIVVDQGYGDQDVPQL
ncbi:hypothetical protein [Candidatus Electronema sp. TJ]|uniref:hypothetical protein n=1 Tax=Candidatus Electronema sp. TJ TaxID=3401573 RepID=UPI003AA7E4C8